MRKQHDKGFTLIEIVVSITLLAIIALFMLPISTYAVQFTKWNNIRFTAMNLAYSQVEWIKSLDYAKELEIEGKKTGLKYIVRKANGSKELTDGVGIIKENFYLNKKEASESNPLVIEGIYYYIQTSLYWHGAQATTGEDVASAMKKIDVTVKAKDPFTGTSKTYSVLGTLITHEGERSPVNSIPLEITAHIGNDIDNLAKNVRMNIHKDNINKSFVDWGMTDEEGKAYFPFLDTGNYLVLPKEWEKGEMIARPYGVKGTYNNMEWEYYSKVNIGTSDDNVKHDVFVDYPGYIELPLDNNYPSDTIVELIPNLEPQIPPLKLSLDKLTNMKLWRSCEYTYSIKKNEDEYFFVDKESGGIWNGTLLFNMNTATTKQLLLCFGLKNNGAYKKNGEEKITEIYIELTSEVQNIDKMTFTINGDLVGEVYSVSQVENGNNRKFKIIFNTPLNVGVPVNFNINNPEALKNAYGMELSKDFNYSLLTLK